MRFRPLDARRSLLLLPLAALALCALLGNWPGAAAEKQILGEVDPEVDLTEKVEVQLSPALRGSGRRFYFVDALVGNRSQDALQGPVFFVVENTGIEGLTVANADGTSDDDGGEAYFEIVADGGELPAQKTARRQRILFTSPKRLRPDERRRFQLDFRVVRGGVASERGRRSSEAEPREKMKLPSPEALERVMQVQDRWSNRLMQTQGVVGTATGVDSQGRAVVVVLAVRAGIEGVPQTVEGVPVQLRVTGRIIARQSPTQVVPLPERSPKPGASPSEAERSRFRRRPRGSRRGDSDGRRGSGEGGENNVDPRNRFQRPVPIGVSTGNKEQCSSGTIACRVRGVDGTLYALSNNHVYALQNNASIGDEIMQPGLADTGCDDDAEDVIGQLSLFVEIDLDGEDNRVDAAIAAVEQGTLSNSTPDDGYGMPSSQTVIPTLWRRVHKYGRTSALTRGFVIGVNATVNVGYSGGTARFVDQIVVMGRRAGFIKAGDSGSLLVTETGNNPVGLLFAGSLGGRFAIANRIDDVLGEFDVTIDGE